MPTSPSVLQSSNPQESIEMETLPNTPAVNDTRYAPNIQTLSRNKRDYAIGIALLMVVVILWTSSNFLTQDLYEGGYDKPFLYGSFSLQKPWLLITIVGLNRVTYMNTSSFSFYLVPFLIRRWWSQSRSKSGTAAISNNYQPLALADENTEPLLRRTELAPELDTGPGREALPPLNEKQTASLAISFCLIWFVANWSVNASLSYTSVASATILSSMSGFFTLGIGRLFQVERLTLLKAGAVCTSFAGVILVSLSDSGSKQAAGPASRPMLQTNVDSRATLGDMLALISALFYAMYVILLKVRIKSESRIDMQLFFGFVGLFNIVACWPIGVLLHFTHLEVFELPSSKKALSALLINMAITLSSDYLYVLAMLKTTPLVVTIGLSLTIPVAVFGDFLRHRPTHGEVLAGALLVLFSFVAVGLEDSKEVDDAGPIVIEGQEP